MKKCGYRSRLISALAGFAIAGIAAAGRLFADDYVVDTFDSDDSSSWTKWWGSATQTYAYDSKVDASGSSSSGSLKATIGFDIAKNGGDNQFSLQHYLPAEIDATTFLTLEFDIKFDPSSPMRPSSQDFGYLEYGFIPDDYSQVYFDAAPNAAVTAKDGNWIHVKAVIDPSVSKLTKVRGVTFKLWAGDTSAGADNALTGTTVFWLDNIKLTAPATTAANNLVVDTFDTDDSSTWTRWWGSATQDYEFDPTVDAANNANSGSLKATIGYDIAAYGGDNQFAVQHYFTDTNGNKVTIDGTKYTNFVFDLKFDPSSPTRPVIGDFGYFEFGLIPTDYSQIWLGGIAVSDGNWVHVTAAIDPTVSKLTAIQGVVLKMWEGDTSANAQSTLTGTTIFWVDNVMLLANTNVAPPPTPAMAIQPASPGLQIFASQAGAQYQRQSIRTINTTGYSWVGQADPVTYSVTIGDYPASTNSGFQTHIFLVPGSGIPNYEDAPDYNEPNLVMLDIQNQADGSATANFRYKTNEPNGNAMVYGAGTLASIANPTPVGTWSMTFSGDTSVTLTAPNGSVTNFSLPSDAAALFADPMYVYVGEQPNQLANIGQSGLLTDFNLTAGATSILHDNFATDSGLDTTNTWQVVAGDAPGVTLVPPTTAYWVTWTTPANGFNLQMKTNLTDASWVNAVSTNSPINPVQVYKLVRAQIPQSTPGANSGFFRLLGP